MSALSDQQKHALKGAAIMDASTEDVWLGGNAVAWAGVLALVERGLMTISEDEIGPKADLNDLGRLAARWLLS